MEKKILLASNNHAKQQRFTHLADKAGLGVQILTPNDIGLEEIDVVEDHETLAGNAEKKARAYFGKTDLPILANDTGFWTETVGQIDAPKRYALQDEAEDNLTKEEVAEKLITFWRQKATDNGGEVNAAWTEAFVLINSDGSVKHADSRREILLTDKKLGEPHIQMPMRSLYISKVTNKPSLQHTEEEELLEMQPIIEALRKLLGE